MSGFFDDSHVTSVGIQGSAGPPVGFGEMMRQSYRQQFRVDSAWALHNELQNRWLESLRAANIDAPEQSIASQVANAATLHAGIIYNTMDPDPGGYLAMSKYVSGQPVDDTYGVRALSSDPTSRIRDMIEANEKIKKLNNPDIKSFEQILEEVSQMQHGVEEETASMYERSGSGRLVASLLGAIGGSFTNRDPLNLVSAPIGAGRTVAMRIATDMAVAAGVVGYTELAAVAPAREIVGLRERNPLYNIAAATIGAGVIRGGIIEPAAAGIRGLRSGRTVEDVDFDLRNSQLQQMFGAVDTPSARAGAKALDDVQFIERNNPYGEGRAAQERFLAELRQVQRAMDVEPMTAVARVMPPMPYESIKRAADFEIVREQAPQIYAKMEAAQAKVADLTSQVEEAVSRESIDLISAVRLLDEDAATRLEQLSIRMSDETQPESVRAAADIESQFLIRQVGPERIEKAADAAGAERKLEVRNLRASRRAANKEYQKAYRQVEAEAVRIRDQQAVVEAKQRRESASILMPTAEGRSFIGPQLQHGYVEDLAERLNRSSETLDDAALARFTRETVGEGEEAVEREAWRTDDGIDIGLRDPVDPEFRFDTDEGETTVAAAMRDLQDDADLDDAMRTCLR